MTTVLEPLPAIEEHKQIKRQTQQLRELEEKGTRATAHLEALVAEQTRLRSTTHSAEVTRLGGSGAGASAADTARLAQLDAEIPRATTEVHALKDALELQQTIARGMRTQLEQERHAQIEATVRSTLATMQTSVQELAALNLSLLTLAEQAPGLLVPYPGLLLTWLEQVRGVTGVR
jgi:crotonobetainyl-CoA:carnitine CoA-transferase CaiB-like acyl-CoA transferase